MRGVFRSTDGGRLEEDAVRRQRSRGVQEIAWAYDHPDVMLATTVRHYTNPLAPGGAVADVAAAYRGPTDTKLFKSIDEGATWNELAAACLPQPQRAHVDRGRDEHQRPADVPDRQLRPLSAPTTAAPPGGRWPPTTGASRNGQSGYNCGVYVDPKNPDIVYTINTSSYRSTDGGNTFTGFKGAPGGDDPQQMWIDPDRRQADVPRRRPGRHDLARRRRDLEFVVQPGDRAGLSHLGLTIPIRTGSTPRSRMPARSPRGAAATSARSRRSTGIRRPATSSARSSPIRSIRRSSTRAARRPAS